ncbi:MAG: hypothetical protein WBA57_16230 [Elainellaceae cyanobacterium]
MYQSTVLAIAPSPPVLTTAGHCWRLIVNPNSHSIYPTRSFIRFQAKNQIIADLTGEKVTRFIERPGIVQEQGTIEPNLDWIDSLIENPPPASGDAQECDPQAHPSGMPAAFFSFDEALFSELAKTTFHPDRHPELYQPCTSQQKASEIEQQVTTELVESYERITRNQTDARVKRLNALL